MSLFRRTKIIGGRLERLVEARLLQLTMLNHSLEEIKRVEEPRARPAPIT